MNSKPKTVIDKALSGDVLDGTEIALLVDLHPCSEDAYRTMWAAYNMTCEASNGLAEVHAQVGVNTAPCPNNCSFCAFAAENGIFNESTELEKSQIISLATRFEADGANAIFLMATADYSLDSFLDIGADIRRALSPEAVMIANVGDFDEDEALRLKEAGFNGVYHALRLGEGRDTAIPPARRLATFKAAAKAGLRLGTCVEPVGPEHTTEEIVEKTLIARQAEPCYSGVARRITIPGSYLAEHGMIGELRMAQLVAVVRLAMGREVIGNCTHEPCVIGAAAGANLFWAEEGSNPRDTADETRGNRGRTVADCRRLFEEAGVDVLDGPSRIYGEEALCARR